MLGDEWFEDRNGFPVTILHVQETNQRDFARVVKQLFSMCCQKYFNRAGKLFESRIKILGDVRHQRTGARMLLENLLGNLLKIFAFFRPEVLVRVVEYHTVVLLHRQEISPQFGFHDCE